MSKLYKGDCLEIMKEIADGSVDAIITDPPYGTTACMWDSVIDFDLMWEQLNRIIKHNGAIVLFGSEPFSSALRMSNIKNYRYDWIWEKNKCNGFTMVNYRPLKNIEIISVFCKSPATYVKNKQSIIYNPQGIKKTNKKIINKKRRNLTTLTGGKWKNENHLQTKTNYPKTILKFNNEYKTKHPTQKPVALMEYLIKTYTNENELVLDFTMGSGSTGVACENTKRNFIGIEQDENYFKIAEKRIKEHQQQTKLF